MYLSLYYQITKDIFSRKTPYRMSVSTLKIDAENFVNLLVHEKSQKARAALCIAKRKELEAIHTVATVRRYLTTYRTELKECAQITKKTALLRSLRIAKKANDKLNTTYANKIVLRSENNDLTPIQQADVTAIIDLAKQFIKSETRYKVAAGLMLLTGRRTAEIYKTGHLSPSKNQTSAKFGGQLKTKSDKEKPPYLIPLLADFADINKALVWLQSQYTFTDIADVNKKVSKDLGVTIKKHFGKALGADVAPHDLRKAYAAIAYANRPLKDENKSFRLYAKNILGHSSANGKIELTSESYRKYTIV